MTVVEFFSSEDKEHWLAQLRKCDWSAGGFLCQLIDTGRFHTLLGSSAVLLLLTDGSRLVSFCTFCEKDEIDDTELTPWIGFVYTYPDYRGRRCFGQLLNEAKHLAADAGFETVYISTDHIGLYEKYGFEYLCTLKNRWADDCRIYKGNVVTD